MKARAMVPKGKGYLLGFLFSISLFLFFFGVWAPGKERPNPGKEAAEKAGMILIPEGEFIQGTDEEAVKVIFHITGVPTKLRDKGPKTKMNLKGFYIDPYEVTNAQYKAFLQATKRHPPEQWTHEDYPPGEGQYPVTHVNWISARLFCEWTGKRLPTEDEWEKAARGSDGRIFPWGDRFEKGKANVWEAGAGKPQEVGKYPEDRSPYGVYDMGGNVLEWTSTIFKNDLAITRGGSWANDGAEARTDKKMISELDVTSNAVGFRCVRSEAP